MGNVINFFVGDICVRQITEHTGTLHFFPAIVLSTVGCEKQKEEIRIRIPPGTKHEDWAVPG